MKTALVSLFLLITLLGTTSVSHAQTPNIAGLIGMSASKNAGYGSPSLAIQGKERAKIKKAYIQQEVGYSTAKKQDVGNGYTLSSRTSLEIPIKKLLVGSTLQVKDTINAQFKKPGVAVGGLVKFNYENSLFPYLRVTLPDSTQNKAYTVGAGFEYYQKVKENYGVEFETEFTLQRYRQYPFPDRQTAYGFIMAIGFYRNFSR